MRRYALVAALLVLIATARIVSTYSSLNHTMDEPIHLGAGMQWLAGEYTWDQTHPPLARIMSAVAVTLAGAHYVPADDGLREGIDVLGRGAQYDRMLTVARLAILPLFWIACASVFLWTWRIAGGFAAVMAILIFTTIPPVLAHAGLVTTDMAATAFCTAAVAASLWWAESPNTRRSTVFGIVLGFGVLSKMSFLVYVPAAWGLMLLWRRPSLKQIQERIRPAVIVGAIACLILFAGYRFSFKPFIEGVRGIALHNAKGHDSYILGERHHTGVWYFFPVTLGVKTPLALLVLVLLSFRERKRIALPALYCLAILFVSMGSRINIGVRHVLPMYAGFAVIAGIGSAPLLQTRARYLVLALLGWQVVSGACFHPDYISYTNEIAAGHPEDFVAESDLDWGQDMYRVADFLHRAGAREVSFTPYNVSYLESGHPFPKCTFSDWYHPAPGWNVVSLSGLKVFNHPGWVKGRTPQFRIGRTHWAWYFPKP
jgi:4-amino-4-deoxy-L-arabinose transferase-like glycosyltransferase